MTSFNQEQDGGLSRSGSSTGGIASGAPSVSLDNESYWVLDVEEAATSFAIPSLTKSRPLNNYQGV